MGLVFVDHDHRVGGQARNEHQRDVVAALGLIFLGFLNKIKVGDF